MKPRVNKFRNRPTLFQIFLVLSLAAHVGAALILPSSILTPAEFAMEPETLQVEWIEPPPPPSSVEIPPPEIPPEPLPPEPPPPEPEPIPEPLPAPSPVVEPPPPPPPPPTPEPPPIIEPPVVEQAVITPPPQAPVVLPEPPIAQAKPDYLRNPAPPYPRLAKERGWEGTTLLRVRVLADGTAADIEVMKTSGHQLLDKVSIEAVRGWKFLPARRGDTPVESWVEIPMTFRLVND